MLVCLFVGNQHSFEHSTIAERVNFDCFVNWLELYFIEFAKTARIWLKYISVFLRTKSSTFFIQHLNSSNEFESNRNEMKWIGQASVFHLESIKRNVPHSHTHITNAWIECGLHQTIENELNETAGTMIYLLEKIDRKKGKRLCVFFLGPPQL